ncbi:hypothetical protein, partial [Pedobacter suwonensis]|uniref:hypothetical protein n=1 Tax=Pedobacter suwonensis TaxID=332999 RepID=UPI0036C3E653
LFAQQLLLFSSNNSGGQFEIGERGSNLLVYAPMSSPLKLSLFLSYTHLFGLRDPTGIYMRLKK